MSVRSSSSPLSHVTLGSSYVSKPVCLFLSPLVRTTSRIVSVSGSYLYFSVCDPHNSLKDSSCLYFPSLPTGCPKEGNRRRKESLIGSLSVEDYGNKRRNGTFIQWVPIYSGRVNSIYTLDWCRYHTHRDY